MGYLDDFDTKEMMGEMEADAKGKKMKTWQPDEGETAVRILPPLKSKGEKKFWFTYNMHWVNRIGYIDTTQELVNASGNIHKAERNPIQEFAQKLYNISERDSEEWKLASSIRSKPRYVFRVVVRGKEDETEPVFWEVGKGLFNKIKDIITSTKVGMSLIDPSSKGRDFLIVKKGQGITTNYNNSGPDIETKPLFDNADDLKKCFQNAEKLDFNSLIEFRSVDEMESAVKILTGEESEEEVRARAPQVEFGKSKEDEEFSDNLNYEEESSDEIDSQIDDIINEFV